MEFLENCFVRLVFGELAKNDGDEGEKTAKWEKESIGLGGVGERLFFIVVVVALRKLSLIHSFYLFIYLHRERNRDY